MRKKNMCLSLGLSALLVSSLTGCVTINVQSDSPVGEAVLENLVESQDYSLVDDGGNLESENPVGDNGENLDGGILESDSPVGDDGESSEISVDEVKPLSFSDYESSLNNFDGSLFFVNEIEFSEVLKPLFDAYSTSSQHSGVVTISEGYNIKESFAFKSDTAWSVVKDQSYLINEFKDGAWKTIEYLENSDSKNNLLCSSKYDSGFDFLLSPDEFVLEFLDCKSLGLGESLFVCNYSSKDDSSGLIEFKVSSDGYLTYIKRTPSVEKSFDEEELKSSELDLVDYIEYRIVYNLDSSYNDYIDSLLTYYNLISSVDNSGIDVSDSYEDLKMKSVGGFNILNRDVYVDASNLLINAYNKSSSLDFCMKYFKYLNVSENKDDGSKPDGELLSQILGYNSDNSYWCYKTDDYLSIISLEEDADGNKSWNGSKYNHNGETEEIKLSSIYDSVLDFILKTDEYTFIITSVEENVSKDIKGKEEELFTLIHLNYLFNGVSGPMDIYLNSDGTLYSTSMLYDDNLYISVFTNINDSSYSELKSEILSNSLSVDNKDLNSLKKILNQVNN